MERGIFKRDFLILIVANFISQFGDRLTHLVIIHFIGEISPGSFFAFSKASLFFALPVVLFGPFAGVFVDRYHKKSLMLLGDFVRFSLVFSLPYLIYLTHINIVWPVLFVVFTFNLVFNSSRYSIIPDIVGVKNSVYANSTMMFFTRIATVLGTVTGGFLVAKVGWRYGFQLDGLTYLASFILILFIVEKGRKKMGKIKIKNYFMDLKEGLYLSLKDKTLLFVMLSVYGMMFVSGVGYGIVIKVVQQDMKMGTGGVSIAGGISALGMILGSVLTGIKGKFNRYNYITLSFLSVSVLLFLAPIHVNFYTISIIMLLAGFFLSVIGITQETLIHETVEFNIRGRIFTFRDVMASISFIINSLLMGFLADRFGFFFIMIISSIFLSILTVTNHLIYKMRT